MSASTGTLIVAAVAILAIAMPLALFGYLAWLATHSDGANRY